MKPEWFEELFGRSMEKYDQLRLEMADEAGEQEKLLERIRVSPLSIVKIELKVGVRSKTRLFCRSGKTIRASESGKEDCKTWMWRTGSGERL